MTERDKEILRRAYEFRFITTNQIERFTDSQSRRKLNHRLRQLWGADFLTRPSIQREVYAYRDQRETVHALGQRGAQWLSTEYGYSFPTGKGFEASNKIKSGTFLEHEIGIAETILKVEADIAEAATLRFVSQTQLLTALGARSTTLQSRLLTMPTIARLANGRREQTGTKPDYTFYLVDQRSEPERKALMFLEYENTRKDASKIASKIARYADCYRRGLHTERFGNRLFRVLFVVDDNDPAYMDLVATAYSEYAAQRCPPGMFLVTNTLSLAKVGLLTQIWRDGLGKPCALAS